MSLIRIAGDLESRWELGKSIFHDLSSILKSIKIQLIYGNGSSGSADGHFAIVAGSPVSVKFITTERSLFSARE